MPRKLLKMSAIALIVFYNELGDTKTLHILIKTILTTTISKYYLIKITF